MSTTNLPPGTTLSTLVVYSYLLDVTTELLLQCQVFLFQFGQKSSMICERLLIYDDSYMMIAVASYL